MNTVKNTVKDVVKPTIMEAVKPIVKDAVKHTVKYAVKDAVMPTVKRSVMYNVKLKPKYINALTDYCAVVLLVADCDTTLCLCNACAVFLYAPIMLL